MTDWVDIDERNIVETTLQTELVSILGRGAHGQAYLTKKGTVAKLTWSELEAVLFYLKMNNNNLDGRVEYLDEVCECYGVWKVEGGAFLIEKEFIPEMITEEEYDANWDKWVTIEPIIGDLHMGNIGIKNNRYVIFDACLRLVIDGLDQLISDIASVNTNKTVCNGYLNSYFTTF